LYAAIRLSRKLNLKRRPEAEITVIDPQRT